MSSIDKGVEQVVSRLGRNVRVVKSGNTIYGYMGGEVVFSMADRYGYINSYEEQIIRDGIRRYDEEEARRRAAREAERRAREEAIQRAREEAERLRREQLEAERKKAHSDLVKEIARKREEMSRSVNAALNDEKKVRAGMQVRSNAVKSLASISSHFDFSEYNKRNAKDEIGQSADASAVTGACRAKLAELEKFASGVSDRMTTEQYRSLIKDVRKMDSTVDHKSNAAYENAKFLEEIESLKTHVNRILPAIKELERLASDSTEVGIIAREALDAISMRKVTGAADFAEFSNITSDRLERITALAEDARIASTLYNVSVIRGAISACKETYEIVATSTYTAVDHRSEIESNATQVLKGFNSLRSAEYTTCDKDRINEVIERLESILAGADKSESVLRETEKLEDELKGYVQADENHRTEYTEYLEIVKSLSEYGIDSSEIEEFSPKAYARQKQMLVARLAQARREFEHTQLIITDMHVKNVMDEMGFELFSSVGDAEGYVREALYTKRGYDGVLWQTVIYANGSVVRRVIGVNKGETQTDVEYVKEVAAEMEQAGDPEEFIVKFRDATGSDIAVNSAVEHDSENVDEAIENNGFHYLRGKALESYQRFVEKPGEEQATRSTQSKTGKPRQKSIVQGRAVRSSQEQLQRAVAQSRAMSHAH